MTGKARPVWQTHDQTKRRLTKLMRKLVRVPKQEVEQQKRVEQERKARLAKKKRNRKKGEKP